MISDKYKCIHIHIPKCAGTSIEIALDATFAGQWDEVNKIWKQHAYAHELKEHYANENQWSSYLKFAIVRNPFERIVSSYNYLSWQWFSFGHCENRPRLVDNVMFKKFIFGKPPFDSIVSPDLRGLKKSRYHHIAPMVDFLLKDGRLLVDYIGRFENIEQEWKIICERLKIEIELPHINSHEHKCYRDYYDKESREFIEDTYKDDIELFGYEF